jgi:hypothetical protein
MILYRLMFRLTQQEQWILVFVMAALITGAILRIYRSYEPLPTPAGSLSPQK